jgi:murein DD-endopeptidase MepM/ murein hydrolase activator NlpD
MGKLRNAIDFIADEETPVLAAGDGVVIFVKDNSNIGGFTQLIGDLQTLLWILGC